MSAVKRILKIGFYVVAAIGLMGIATIIILNQPLPFGVEGDRAEAAADAMLAAVNEPAWNNLRYVTWNYRDEHRYVWDKWYNIAEVTFDDERVLISLNTLEGRAWKGAEQLQDEEKRAAIQRAWEFWCNDSFWLNPFVKLRDEGTVRQLVERKDGTEALMVTYTQGGVTPGDSYLWIYDQEGLPVACRMWVKSLPVKGIYVSWENWKNLDGALVAQSHKIGPVTIEITDIACGDHHSDLGLEKDPFADF